MCFTDNTTANPVTPIVACDANVSMTLQQCLCLYSISFTYWNVHMVIYYLALHIYIYIYIYTCYFLQSGIPQSLPQIRSTQVIRSSNSSPLITLTMAENVDGHVPPSDTFDVAVSITSTSGYKSLYKSSRIMCDDCSNIGELCVLFYVYIYYRMKHITCH